MEQVAAKQRIKVAVEDHMLISWVHLRLHPKVGVLGMIILLVSAIVALIITAVLQPSVEIQQVVISSFLAVVTLSVIASYKWLHLEV